MKKRSVLFIDDEPENIKNYVDYLEFEGFEVSTCTFLEDLDKALKRKTFDVIILDVIIQPKAIGAPPKTDNQKNKIHRAGLTIGLPKLKKLKKPIIILTNVPLNQLDDQDLSGFKVIGQLFKPLTKPSKLLNMINRA